MSLPTGVEHRPFNGRSLLATRGPPIGDEATDGDWRAWDPRRSKLGAMLDHGLPVTIGPETRALYLGAAAGTTASHVADVARTVYAVEFAARPMRDLVRAADPRPSLVPLLKDARRPEAYAHVVEADLDLLVQDVATRDQAAVANRNARFLADDGQLALAVKARSEDVTAAPAEVYDAVLSALSETYDVNETMELAPAHVDHLAVLATPRR